MGRPGGHGRTGHKVGDPRGPSVVAAASAATGHQGGHNAAHGPGLRVAAASAVLGAMLSEWVTGSRGLGVLILESGVMREIEVLWAAVITSVIFALM